MKKKTFSKICAFAVAAMVAITGAVSYVPVQAATINTQAGVANAGSGSASITISGNDGQTLVGKSFEVFKIFNAQNSKNGESINYTFNPTYEQAVKNVVAKGLSQSGTTEVSAADVTEYAAIDYIQSLNNYKVEGATTEQELESRYSQFRYFVEDLRDEIKAQKLSGDIINVQNTKNDGSVTISGLAYGYYIVDEISNVQGTHAASSLCIVDTANPNANVSVKSDYPSVTKKIQEDDENADITDGNRWNDIGDYEIGQTVPYKFTSNIPDMNGYDTYYYAWHDVMASQLTFNKNSVDIKISDGSKTYTLDKSEFTVTENPGNGDTFMVEIQDIKAIVDREYQNFDEKQHNVYGQSVVLTYNATLNDSAAQATGRPGFENDVRLEFSNDADSTGEGSTGYTPWDTVVCFTYKLNTEKINNHDLHLEGAKFRLYSDKDCTNEVYVKEGNGGYIVINRDSLGGTDHTGGKAPSNSVEMVSGSDGTFTIFGLDDGTYYLKETSAPDGYRTLLDPIELVLDATITPERDSYVKGNGATEATLQAFDATAQIKSFYNGLFNTENETLETNVEDGSANLTVVNEVGMKLPVTGTSATLIIVAAGAALMVVALVWSKKKKAE